MCVEAWALSVVILLHSRESSVLVPIGRKNLVVELQRKGATRSFMPFLRELGQLNGWPFWADTGVRNQ